jgi:ferric-dicitrate binding protein FerR (iron transport regulator)
MKAAGKVSAARVAAMVAAVFSISITVVSIASCGGAKAPAASTQQTGGDNPAPAVATPVPQPGQPAAAKPSSPATTPQPSGSAAQAATTTGTGSTASVPSAAAAATPGTTAANPAATAAAAQRKIGEIVFTEGFVSIHRAGASTERGDIGSVVRQYDVLVTGSKSRAEVDLAAGTAGGASIKLAENTAFYFDTKELNSEQRKTVVQMLSGAVAIKVDKLANGSFQIATEQAVLGVRGTVFIVDSVPDGSLLVTCETGAVEVTVGGVTRTAKPGGVVELPESGEIRLLAVEPAELGKYRGDWRADAYKNFAPQALSYTSAYASAIERGKPAFDAAYAKLKAQAPAIDAWRTAKAAGKTPRFTDWIAEKKAVSAVLLDCLKAMFPLERPYYRLLEMKSLHAGGVGVGTLKDGRQSSDYFRNFESGNANLVLGMAKVREALLLFSWASAGSPLGDFFGAKAESLGTGSLFLED